jgi:hypothetical protein
MTATGVKGKDKLKSKFQLFLNGTERQNSFNPVYRHFTDNHPNFTELLFRYKKGINLSNETNKVEASVMHSPELNEYLKGIGLNADIIHDCLWIYGSGKEVSIIPLAAHFILTLFKEKHNIDMVFTLELKGKPKEIIDVNNWFTANRVRLDFSNIEDEYQKTELELKHNKHLGFMNRFKPGAYDEYWKSKKKIEDLLLKSEPIVEARLACEEVLKNSW